MVDANHTFRAELDDIACPGWQLLLTEATIKSTLPALLVLWNASLADSTVSIMLVDCYVISRIDSGGQ